jgi:hypothetical protein
MASCRMRRGVQKIILAKHLPSLIILFGADRQRQIRRRYKQSAKWQHVILIFHKCYISFVVILDNLRALQVTECALVNVAGEDST